MACKTYKFQRRDRNRYRKVYRYIRKKPRWEYCSDGQFTIISGQAEFSNTAGPVTVLFADCDATASFLQVPSVTATAVDSEDEGAADVNVFITSITTDQVQISVSAPFKGTVHFQVVSVD
jgi:hypothetical protein